MKFLNEKPFEHTSKNGTRFTCPRCDFRETIKVEIPIEIWPNFRKIGVDIAEMIGYHCGNVWKQLNGFQGYDCIDFQFEALFEDNEEEE